MLDRLVFSNAANMEQIRGVYEEHGLFVIRNLLDASLLADFRAAIATMIHDRLATIGKSAPAGADLDGLFNSLCDADRTLGSQVYDHIKELPSFYSLLVDRGVTDVIAGLLGTRMFQMPYDICLFRIDRPSEDKFTFDWHQDYPYNLLSETAVTVWLPLTDLEEDMGLLKVVPGAHRSIIPIEIVDPEFKIGKGQAGGARSIRMARSSFEDFESNGFTVPMKAGDVMFFHCMTPHRSGANRSRDRRARWVMNPRYGNLRDPKMVKRGWQSVRKDNFFLFPSIHPDLTVERTAAE